MSNLTEETRELARKHNIPVHYYDQKELYLYGQKIPEVIAFLSTYLDKEDATVGCSSDEYSGDQQIFVSIRMEHSEEVIKKWIQKRIAEKAAYEKQKELAKLSKSKRLEIEIKDIEKTLAAKKKKLAKAKK